MRQEDYILREIHKMGEMLMGLIGKLVKRKKSQEVYVEEAIKKELMKGPEELRHLLDMSVQDIIQLHKDNYVYSMENLEYIAHLYFEFGILFKETNVPKAKIYLEKTVGLYNFIENESTVYSLLRKSKIDEA